jgi:hypothetical protein
VLEGSAQLCRWLEIVAHDIMTCIMSGCHRQRGMGVRQLIGLLVAACCKIAWEGKGFLAVHLQSWPFESFSLGNAVLMYIPIVWTCIRRNSKMHGAGTCNVELFVSHDCWLRFEQSTVAQPCRPFHSWQPERQLFTVHERLYCVKHSYTSAATQPDWKARNSVSKNSIGRIRHRSAIWPCI